MFLKNKIVTVSFVFFFLYALPLHGLNSESKNILLVQNFLHAMFERESFDPKMVEKYLDRDYKQWVNEQPPLDFEGFKRHLLAQKKIAPTVKITFLDMVVQGDKVAEIHHITAIKKNLEIIEGKVIAFWTIKNGKIARCEELTKITKGQPEDEKLAHIK